MGYRIEYSEPQNGTCGGTNPAPLSITASDFSTALDIMEMAANEGMEYEFSASFFGVLGYLIDGVNGVQTEAPCSWTFYIRAGSIEIVPDIAVSDYVPGNNFEVILRYEQVMDTPFITTTYVIEYPDPLCSSATPPAQINIARPNGSFALDVMEEAVSKNGPEYRFSVDYTAVEGGGFGYVIEQVNGVARNGSCSWTPFLTSPGQNNNYLCYR